MEKKKKQAQKQEYQDSVSAKAHQMPLREWLRQKLSRTWTVNVWRYQNHDTIINNVDHLDWGFASA